MSHSFLLLNSFDRSGSTLISKILAEHPQVENLFNPFNASVFKRTFMQVWTENAAGDKVEEGRKLVDSVLEGRFTKEVIRSRVFFPHSSTDHLVDGSLHILKTTNFHNKLAWFRANYPDIRIVGLLRRPIAILSSLVRNGFHTAWYGDWAYEQLRTHVEPYGLADEVHSAFMDCTDEVEQMAWVIALLNRKMVEGLRPEDHLRYEDVIQDPDEVLNAMLSPYELEHFHFAPYFKMTVNSSGKQFQGKEVYKEVFTKEEISRYNAIFEQVGQLGY